MRVLQSALSARTLFRAPKDVCHDFKKDGRKECDRLARSLFDTYSGIIVTTGKHLCFILAREEINNSIQFLFNGFFLN